MDKLAGVYKITNKQNSKIYIGESEDISHRWIEHVTDLVCGEHCNSKLQIDFNIYGIKNFEFDVLETFKIDENDNNNSSFKLKMTLLCREHVYIHHFDSIDNGYNIVDSLKETLTNNIRIFNRDGKSSELEQLMIHNFMKDNPDILKLDWTNDYSSIQKVNKKKAISKKSKPKKQPIEVNGKYLTTEFKLLKEQGLFNYISPDISDGVFKEILKSKGLLIHTCGYEASEYSLNHNFMIKGEERHRKNESGSFIRPILTELGEQEVINIFKSENILQDTVKVIKQLRQGCPSSIYYDKFNQYF